MGSFIDRIAAYNQPKGAGGPAPTVAPPSSPMPSIPSFGFGGGGGGGGGGGQSISGPVNAKQQARVGAQNISISYLPDLGMGLVVVGVIVIGLLALWLLA